MKSSWIIKKIMSEKLVLVPGRALDLGCGEGDDAMALATSGYEVDAVDRHRDSILTLRQRSKNLPINALHQTIESFSITPGQYTVIIANNSLPFLGDKETVKAKILEMFAGLSPEGVVAFSLFGPKDAWIANNRLTFFEYTEALAIMEAFPGKIYYQACEEGYGLTMSQRLKFWHLFRFMGLR